MLRKILMVVLMLSLVVFPASVGASVNATSLNFSHACDLGTGELEVHFVLVQSPDVDYTGTFVAWEASFDGGPHVTGASLFDNRTGGAAHYRVNVPLASAVEVFDATLVVGDTTYQLSNPGVFDVSNCIPTAVVIETFTVACSGVPYGSEAAVAWSVSTELLSTRYLVALNGEVVLNVPAACPGCTAAASYERSVSLPDAHGIYSLLVYNGSDLTDMREFWLAPCAAPTAVTVSAFTANTARKWWQVWR